MFKTTFAFIALIAVCFTITSTSCNDPCDGVSCVNGSCEAVGDEGVCECDLGYEGTLCDEEMRTKFVANYLVTDSCTLTGVPDTTYRIGIAAFPDDLLGVVITGFYDSTFVNPVTGTIASTSITIPRHAPDGDGIEIEGKGEYTDGIMLWDYLVIDTHTGDVDACTFTAIKQED